MCNECKFELTACTFKHGTVYSKKLVAVKLIVSQKVDVHAFKVVHVHLQIVSLCISLDIS